MMILGDYGVAHEHRWENREPDFRECALCHLVEVLPGRRVTVGDKVLRVAEPPPPWLEIPRPSQPTAWAASGPTLTAEEPAVDRYRWDHGSQRYVLASR